jgi:hypothetical protein
MYSITVLQFDLEAAGSSGGSMVSSASTMAASTMSASQVGTTSLGQSQAPSLSTVPGGPTITQPQVPASSTG